MKTLRSVLLYPLLACCVCWAPVVYSQPQQKNELLMSEPISSVEGRQVNVTRIEIPPGHKTPSHSHPGESFVYILSGRILNQIGEAEPVIYEAGEFFFEEANALHAQFENLDTENPAVFLVFGIRPIEAN